MTDIFKRQMAPPPPPSPERLAFNNSAEILSIIGAFTGFASVVVLSRLYVRTTILRVFGVDDYIIVVSMLLSVGVLITIIGQTYHGLGRHLDTWSPVDFYNFQKWMFAQAIIIVTGVSSVKISVGFSLLRLWKGTKYTKIVWVIIVFTILFCLACNGTLIFQCLPVAAAWDFSLRPPPFGTGDAKCYSIKTFQSIGLFNSVTNILTDILFATLPIPLIWQLQLNMRTKLSLIAILSLGYFASGAAIVKAVKQWHFFTDTDWSVHDSFNVWNDIEFNVGIVAACLPSLKPLFNWFLETARAMTTGSGTNARSRERFGYGYGSRAYKRSSSLGYLKQQDSSFAMDDMRSRSNFSAGAAADEQKSPYRVRVSVGRAGEEEEGFGGAGGGGRRGFGHGGGHGNRYLDKELGKEGTRTPSWENDAAKRSDDSILPLQIQRPEKGIVRTTEVTIT